MFFIAIQLDQSTFRTFLICQKSARGRFEFKIINFFSPSWRHIRTRCHTFGFHYLGSPNVFMINYSNSLTNALSQIIFGTDATFNSYHNVPFRLLVTERSTVHHLLTKKMNRHMCDLVLRDGEIANHANWRILIIHLYLGPHQAFGGPRLRYPMFIPGPRHAFKATSLHLGTQIA